MGSLSRSASRVLGLPVATLAAVWVTAGPATAQLGDTETEPPNRSAGPPPGAACSTDGWAHGCYEPYGDVIWVKDDRADGHRAVVHFWFDGKGWEEGQTCQDPYGSAGGWYACDGFAGMIPEESVITLWPFEVDNDGTPVPNSGSSRLYSSTS